MVPFSILLMLFYRIYIHLHTYICDPAYTLLRRKVSLKRLWASSLVGGVVLAFSGKFRKQSLVEE